MKRTRLLLVGDTHARSWGAVHGRVRAAVAEADIAVLAGDIVSMAVVEGFRKMARRSYIVHGNSDPPDVRAALPERELFAVDGVRIGLTHPAWGGPEFEPEVLLDDFPEGVDVILYGHLHETVNVVREGVLFLNGGQPYPQFLTPGTVAWLTIENGKPRGEIEQVAEPL